MKTRITILLLILIYFLCGCNNSQGNVIDNDSFSLTETEETTATPEVNNSVNDIYSSIQYKVVNVESLIELLNTYYEDKIIQPFENHIMAGQPFSNIDYRYEFDFIDNENNIKAVSKFIQGRIAEKDTIINISIIEDKTFNNGGYVFSNANNFYYNYISDDKYTMSIYKYKKSYIIFEFFSNNFNSDNKKEFVTNFAEILEENYNERDKLIYNDNEEYYILKTFLIKNLKDGLNIYYKKDIKDKFTQVTKSEIPLYKINERYILDKISENDESILAVTKYLQGLIGKNDVKISVIEDKTHDNNGYVFTTDSIDSNTIICVYRYHNIYIVFEFYNSSVQEDDIIKHENTISKFSNIMINLLQ